MRTYFKGGLTMNENFSGVGERIALLLSSLNTKQSEVYKAIDISKNAMSNYVNGNRIPDTKALYKLSKFFNTSMEWLLTGEGNTPNYIVENEKSCSFLTFSVSQTISKSVDLPIDKIEYPFIPSHTMKGLLRTYIQQAGRVNRLSESDKELFKEKNVIYLAEKLEDILKEKELHESSTEFPANQILDELVEDEIKIIQLYRQLSDKDKIKIEGILEMKVSEANDSLKGRSSTLRNGEEAATEENSA